MTIWAYRPESRWKRQRRLRRMVDKACMPRTGVVLPNHSWHVYALGGGLMIGNAVLFVRMWM